jgi:hypothetical protein
VPQYAWALTSGNIQPEFQGYQEPGGQDMVNLLTGDFSFSIPILEVPGPEGGFNLPLSYSAGIATEQEATWVGLGWSLNPGAITRSYNGYPDDANGQLQTVQMEQLVARGWNSSLLAIGNIGWDTKQGHYGAIGIFGFNYSFSSKSPGTNGLSFDVRSFGLAILNAVTRGAISAAGGSHANALSGQTKGRATSTIGNALIGQVLGSAMPISPTAGTATLTKRVEQGLFHKNYWIWLDQTRQEGMYGSLYLQNAVTETHGSSHPTLANLFINVGGSAVTPSRFEAGNSTTPSRTASDINYFLPETGAYRFVRGPATLANDQFSVKAPGIAGSISPYRLDIGSVAVPKQMTIYHRALAPVRYSSYKVPFMYDGTNSGSYYHHSGGTSSVAQPGFNFNISTAVGTTNPSTNESLTLNFNDIIFQGQRFNPALGTSRKLPNANHVEWYSNAELATIPGGFIDYFRIPADRAAYRSNHFDGTPKASGSIGAFSITNSNGMTYHFALSIHDFNQSIYIEDVNDASKKSTISRPDKFSNTWLLTAITGSDFIDRGNSNGTGNGVLDDSDWGYWVKFNYGRTDDYEWKIPYQNNGFITSSKNDIKSRSSGTREHFYLNSIETRSHIALFWKKNRVDGLGVYFSKPSFFLSEIALLSKEHYKKLVSDFGFVDHTGTLTEKLMAFDHVSYLYPSPPPLPDSEVFIRKNAVKRVVFGYMYNGLCTGVPNLNSSPPRPYLGKLTLERVSILGRDSQKIVPDYVFSYSNASYQIDAWDGWGMYNPSATSTSRQASSVNDYGSAWSLNKITTPLGASINVQYERDTYGSISGERVLDASLSFGGSNYTIPYYGPSSMNLSTLTVSPTVANSFSAGDLVKLTGTIRVYCQSGSYFVVPYSGEFTISSKTSTSITFSNYYVSIQMCSGNFGTNVNVEYNGGTLAKVRLAKPGGNIRVSSLSMKDGQQEYKTRYLYDEGGMSMGVLAQEPDWIKQHNYPFYDIPGYPSTPVMYKRVTVLSGRLTSDSDFHTRQVFNFETPHTSHYTLATNVVASDQLIRTRPIFGSLTSNDYLTVVQNNISDYSSAIGRVNSVETYDASGVLQNKLQNIYSHSVPSSQPSSYQGVYTNGTILSELVDEPDYKRYNRVNRTTVISYPSVLTKAIVTQEGLYSSETENIEFDYLSGLPTIRKEKNERGISTKTVSKPLYRIAGFGEFGPKASNSANKNMVTANAAEYTYLLGPTGNELGLVSAQAQTWKKNWEYRDLNSAGTSYVSNTNGPAWRKGDVYSYYGNYARLRSDGTLSFSTADEFNFSSGASNSGWKLMGGTTRYDHFSMPLERTDQNNIRYSVLMGYGDRIKIAEASNAEYAEIAFSSAEDKISSAPFFGSEVGIGSGSLVSKRLGQVTEVHTGDYAVSLGAGQNTFVFKSVGLKPQKEYRASVWTNSPNARIYYRVDTGSEVLSQAPTSALKVGNWYLLHFRFTTPSTSFASVEVGVRSMSGSILVDDFRFQPADAFMSCYVYNPLNFEFSLSASDFTTYEYILDNEHLYSKTEFNKVGQPVKRYIESIKFQGVKLVSESKDDYRRFYEEP